jgi:hypothetical protein
METYVLAIKGRDGTYKPHYVDEDVYIYTRRLECIIQQMGSKYHDGNICICDMKIGNPMVNDHSDACKSARKLEIEPED